MSTQEAAETVREALTSGGYPLIGMADAITALDALVATAERADRLAAALEEIALHGTRHDTNPTVMVYADNDQWFASHQWWVERARSMDASVRGRARAALASTGKDTE